MKPPPSAPTTAPSANSPSFKRTASAKKTGQIRSDLQKEQKEQKARNSQNQTTEPAATASPATEPIRFVRKGPKHYTQHDLELASAHMSDAEFDGLLDEI